ncbi:glucan endo-1,3-alpha-glucosidase [Acrasis kona]|uniref:Glucan endo-1,3-alpha-glucosidase n=1 Tax=Acrasis kona TaxID=1008807 RepID=A0AAW2YLZ0_9EUKA
MKAVLFAVFLALVCAVSSRKLLSSISVSNTSATNEPRYVFAHYMIGNSYATTQEMFKIDLIHAVGMGVDGFALNLGPEDWMWDRVEKLYTAARDFPNFKLFFSFDMHRMGDPNAIVEWIRRFSNRPNTYKYNNKIFVSTFAGESQSFGESGPNEGWNNKIKNPLRNQGIEIFFVPAWTAMGPNNFFDRNWVVDGAFSWNSWPNGGSPMTTAEDDIYMNGARQKGKAYMAPLSPWFYTHLPQWNKNFLYKSEFLLLDRWEQMLRIKPEMIEIVTWNDWGESSYLGPIQGAKPENSDVYVDGYDHIAFREMSIPFLQAYKNGQDQPTINKDAFFFWYRPHSKNAGCGDGYGRPERWDLVEDNVYVVVFATSDAQMVINTGGQSRGFPVRAGVNRVSTQFVVGSQSFELQRNGQPILKATGSVPVYDNCPKGTYNFNCITGVGK